LTNSPGVDNITQSTVVYLTPEAQREADDLPFTMQARLDDILTRLERWPSVSGYKALTGRWRGHYRIRMGDWRVIFQVVAPTVIVVRIAHRPKVYE
jgi:mRNA-degrading endonuclease RelE of RelBE toxin-antitoxin system